MTRIFLFLAICISLASCKYVVEKSFGPLKLESLNYKPLLTDSILAHNPEVVKYIEFDTVSMIVKVIYDEDKGDVSELEGYITKLDLIAPIVVDTLANQMKEAERKEAKTDSTLKDFIRKTIVADSGKRNELLRLDSLRRVKLRLDSLAQDSLKADTVRKDSL
jgi:hypothetical protein